MKLMKIMSLSVVILLTSITFYACKKKIEEEKSVISIKGSDTMVNLAQKWAEEFMAKNKDVSIQVTGGGSGTGIAALLNATTDIATSSRELKEKEISTAKEKKIEYQTIPVALDGLAIIVQKDNPIESLTIEQLRDIFIGKVKNFKELGGKDEIITLYGRENSSGTYEFFREHVLGKDAAGKQNDYATSIQVLQGTSALAEAVAKDVKGIAYGGVGYFALRNDVKIIKVQKNKTSLAIAPAQNGIINYEAVWSGDYAISRYLYIFTPAKSSAATTRFIEFIKSSEGRAIVKASEYIPLPEKKG